MCTEKVEVLYVVGDHFGSFSKLENVYTYSAIMKKIESNEFKFLRKFYYVIGQGISKSERKQLQELSHNGQIGLIANGYQKPASTCLTHKQKNENIIITEPLMYVRDKIYRAYLAIDDSCAEMSDHVTGLHIQGMVLTEAARQMMLAVAEKFILKPSDRGNSYCVLTKMTSQFFQFAFPVDVKIEHEILQLFTENKKGYEVNTRTQFVQNNKIVAHVDIDYKFRDKSILESIENKMALDSLKSNINLQLDNLYLDTVA